MCAFAPKPLLRVYADVPHGFSDICAGRGSNLKQRDHLDLLAGFWNHAVGNIVNTSGQYHSSRHGDCASDLGSTIDSAKDRRFTIRSSPSSQVSQ